MAATATKDLSLVVPAGLANKPVRRQGAGRAIREARPMVWLSAVEGGARLLSFGFYLLAARVLAPQGFGVVQYTITVAMLAFGGLQVLATALMRELGAVRGDQVGRNEVLGSGLALAGGLWAVTSALCVLAHGLGLAKTASALGLLVVVAGTAAFQLYYAVSRGLGDPGRQAASYAGASLAQLLMFGALVVVTHPTPTGALLMFGLSSFIPVLLYEWRRPVLRTKSLRVRRAVLRRLWLLAAPLVIAQVCYVVWNSLDQLWVQGALGTFQVGLYSSAKNLTLGLLVVPAGIAGVLLPRVSQLKNAGRAAEARRLVIWGTTGAVAASAPVAFLMGMLRVPLLDHLYGHAYGAAAGALAMLSLGMICYAGFAVLTIAAVGWGRPKVYTAGMALAPALEALFLVGFGHHSLLTAACAYSASIAGAFLFVLLLLCVRPLRSAEC
jgi:O-antigen/teichoic acid export membrane protein